MARVSRCVIGATIVFSVSMFHLHGAGAVEEPPKPGESAQSGESATRYAVDISVDGDQALSDLMRRGSNLVALIGSPPTSRVGLERRVDADRQRLDAVMRSEGYYAGRLDVSVSGGGATGESVKIAIVATPGVRYAIAHVAVEGMPKDAGGEGGTDGVEPWYLSGLVRDAPARAADVVAAEGRILDRLRDRGYAYAKAEDRRVVVDHDRRVMDVTYRVAPGPLVTLGAATVSGAPGVDDALVLNRLPWKRGDRYDPTLLSRARRDVAGLGVFDTVLVALDSTPDRALAQGGEAPVNVTLTERKRRFVGASALYSTSDGFGLKGWWGHRNLLGGAERMRVDMSVARLGTQTASSDGLSDTDFRLGGTFDVPDFLAVDQDLHLGLTFLTENPAAYERDAQVLEARVDRRFAHGWTVSAGVEQETASVNTAEESWDVALLGAPIAVGRDTTLRPLDPRQGYRASLSVAPWWPVGGSDDASGFVAVKLGGSVYHDLVGEGGLVLAGRLDLGAIFAPSLGDVPPHRRLFAGGSSSVRGYGTQLAGPRDSHGDPTGGLGLIDGGVEARIMVTDDIGIVPFVDAAMVAREGMTEFDDGIRAGAGIGVRYHTEFGPLRADVAMPFRRERDDDIVQFYISFGQAF